MKYIITIGREYGSGGRFIAKLLAEKLNIAYYDSEIINKACDESGLSKQALESYDERKDGLFSSGMGLYSYDMSLGQRVFLAQFTAIKKIASEDKSCIIVGRCADYILKDFENVVNVFICAPMADKIYRAIKYYGLSSNKAESQIVKMNKKRKAYYNFYTDKDWGKAHSYDICVNSKIGIDETVEAIYTYVKLKFHL